MATNTLANLLVRIGADASGLDKELTKIERKMNQFGSRLQDVGRRLTTSLTLPLAAIGGTALKTAVDWESAFAGVIKTVDATEAELADLSAGIRKMATETPHSAVELAKLGEAAGQLGIKTDAILGFTKVVADLGVATANLHGEEAAQGMARFANIMQMSQHNFDRLGSAIVHLGNNLATTEGEIMEFGVRIAGAGKIAGLTEAQVLAIGGAMSSVGVQAEAGGTAVQKVLMNLTQAVAQGTDKLGTFAKAAGMSAQDFAKLWREDAAEAFTRFVEGLGRAGEDAFVVLEELGLQDQRLMRSFLSLAGAGDLLRESIELGTVAWHENSALTREAEIRYNTFEQQLKQFRNQLTEVGITLGESLMPAAKAALEAAQPMVDSLGRLAEGFADMSPWAQKAWINVGLFLAALGPAGFIIGGAIKGVSGLVAAFNLLKGSQALGAILSMFPAVKVAFAGMTAGAYGFGTALNLALGPIGWVVLALTGLAAAANYFVKDWTALWDGLKAYFSAWWENTKAQFQLGWEGIKYLFWSGINAILKLVEPLTKVLPEEWQGAFRGMRRAVEESMDASGQKVLGFAETYVDSLDRMGQATKKMGSAFKAKKDAKDFDDSLVLLNESADDLTGGMGDLTDLLAGLGDQFGSAGRGAGGLNNTVDLLSLRLERLQSQWGAYAAVNADAAGSTSFLDARLGNLNEQLGLVNHQVEEMSRRYWDVANATGEYSAEALKLGTELDGLIEKQANLTAEIKRTEEEKRKVSGANDPFTREWMSALNILAKEGNHALGQSLADMGWKQIHGIPGLALGGTVRSPGRVLVGERGPEYLDLPRGATVTPLDRAGGDTYNITLHAHGVNDPDKILRTVAESIRRGRLAQ